jgi:phospholipase C
MNKVSQHVSDSAVFPPPMTRRRLLGSAAGIGLAAAASGFLPPNVRRALAQTPPGGGSLREIKHVVLLMQENRSFDHYFGTMAGVRGFGDPDALILPGGKSVFHQPDAESPGGYLLPFHLDTRKTNAQKIPTTSHEWEVQHAAWNGGKMDQWVAAHRKADGANGPFVMGHYTRADIPFHFALAEAFTICDAYHCSVLGPTNPNRHYWQTGAIIPRDDQAPGHEVTANHKPAEGKTWKTYPERLEEAGVSWKIYRQEKGWSMLENFKAFREATPGTPLYDKAVALCKEGEFEFDALNDRLPAVTWIMTDWIHSEHPDSMPAAGAAFIASKIDAIAANPEVWAKTAFILNYDENDGLFDHVPPPTPPPGTPFEYLHGVPIGAGFRVPCIIVSPWTVGGWVCSQPFDHTSVIQFLEKFTGVSEPNLTDWRRQTFGDLASAFRFHETKAAPPPLPGTGGALSRAHFEAATLPKPAFPSAEQTLPAQETGERKRIPRA